MPSRMPQKLVPERPAITYPSPSTMPPVMATIRGPARRCQRPAKSAMTTAKDARPTAKITCVCVRLNPNGSLVSWFVKADQA